MSFVYILDGVHGGDVLHEFPLLKGNSVDIDAIMEKLSISDGYLELPKKHILVPSDFLEPGATYAIRGEEKVTDSSVGMEGGRTGVLFEKEMCNHIGPSYHPEKPVRVSSCIRMLRQRGLWDKLIELRSKVATDEQLLRVHSRDYIDFVKNSAKKSKRRTRSSSSEFDDVSTPGCSVSEETFLCHSTYDAAALASGCVCRGVEAVVSGEVQNAFAFVRPPGHHASRSTGHGFCVFNHCAVGALHARQSLGLSRVLILDIDVHHGDGIYDIFKEDPSVLYLSLHRYDDGNYFPGEGHAYYCGIGDGEGKTVHIPWDSQRSNEQGDEAYNDADYMAAFHHIVLPITREFNPELVIIAAGFDAVKGDPLGKFNLSSSFYGAMMSLMMNFASGKVLAVLEGGYEPKLVARCVEDTMRVMMGEPVPVPKECSGKVSPAAWRTIKNVILFHSHYWESLRGLSSMMSAHEDAKQREEMARNDDTAIAVERMIGLTIDEKPEERS